MIRQIIHIDKEKCNGCGLCAVACHEGAIDIVDGKAKLVRENFCDGFGDCLPNCPTGAITFEEREAPAYDETAVKASQSRIKESAATANQNHINAVDADGRQPKTNNSAEMNGNSNRLEEKAMNEFEHAMHQHQGGCPGSAMMQFKRNEETHAAARESSQETPLQSNAFGQYIAPVSRLEQWPCQIKLVPTQAPFFDGAKLLIAADCTAYAYANMHEEFMKGKTTIIGCPKLDAVDYSENLTEIIANNDIKSVTIVRMEVPCCGGLQRAAEIALKNSGKFIPWQVVTISRDGRILD